MRWIAAAAILLASISPAFAQVNPCSVGTSTSVNPPVNSVYTYCGPSVGAVWVLPATGTLLGPSTTVIGDLVDWTNTNGTGLGDTGIQTSGTSMTIPGALVVHGGTDLAATNIFADLFVYGVSGAILHVDEASGTTTLSSLAVTNGTDLAATNVFGDLFVYGPGGAVLHVNKTTGVTTASGLNVGTGGLSVTGGTDLATTSVFGDFAVYNGSSPVFTVHSTGIDVFVIDGVLASGSASGGGAGGLPATPAGYVSITVGANPQKIPYYNP